jgi:hypothetical protein
VNLTEFILWVVLGLSVVGLVVLQVRSMLAAARIGGSSARTVILLRSALVVAVLGLFGYVVYVQAMR